MTDLPPDRLVARLRGRKHNHRTEHLHDCGRDDNHDRRDHHHDGGDNDHHGATSAAGGHS